jgi:hypothetical protein
MLTLDLTDLTSVIEEVRARNANGVGREPPGGAVG